MKQENKQTGRVNYVWVLAGGYLWYLAYQLLRTLWRGEASGIALPILGAVVFVGTGAVLFRREWKAYEYGKKHMNDPSTWSDEPLEPAEITESAEDTEEPHGT